MIFVFSENLNECGKLVIFVCFGLLLGVNGIMFVVVFIVLFFILFISGYFG